MREPSGEQASLTLLDSAWLSALPELRRSSLKWLCNLITYFIFKFHIYNKYNNNNKVFFLPFDLVNKTENIYLYKNSFKFNKVTV